MRVGGGMRVKWFKLLFKLVKLVEMVKNARAEGAGQSPPGRARRLRGRARARANRSKRSNWSKMVKFEEQVGLTARTIGIVLAQVVENGPERSRLVCRSTAVRENMELEKLEN